MKVRQVTRQNLRVIHSISQKQRARIDAKPRADFGFDQVIALLVCDKIREHLAPFTRIADRIAVVGIDDLDLRPDETPGGFDLFARDAGRDVSDKAPDEKLEAVLTPG